MVENRRSPSRAPRSRVITTRSQETPRWVWIGLVVAPIVLIVLVLAFRGGKTPVDTDAGDPNQKITRLEGEVSDIQKSFRRFFKLVRAEDPSASTERKKLEVRVKRWMEQWDAIFEPHRDDNGDLPVDLQGYQTTRSKINQVRVDLVKATGF